jgi:hypothetical protein
MLQQEQVGRAKRGRGADSQVVHAHATHASARTHTRTHTLTHDTYARTLAFIGNLLRSNLGPYRSDVRGGFFSFSESSEEKRHPKEKERREMGRHSVPSKEPVSVSPPAWQETRSLQAIHRAPARHLGERDAESAAPSTRLAAWLAVAAVAGGMLDCACAFAPNSFVSHFRGSPGRHRLPAAVRLRPRTLHMGLRGHRSQVLKSSLPRLLQ